MNESKEFAFSRATVALMKGAVSKNRDPGIWNTVIEQRFQIYDYVGKIGLELVVNEIDGYAFLKQRDYQSGEDEIPRLIPRHPLSYHASLLLILLRKKLLENDSDAEGGRLILSGAQIIDLMKTYMRDSMNEAKVTNDIVRYIDRLCEMGFVRRLTSKDESEVRYEVQRIICNVVGSEWLRDFDAKMEAYLQNSESVDGDGNDE